MSKKKQTKGQNPNVPGFELYVICNALQRVVFWLEVERWKPTIIGYLDSTGIGKTQAKRFLSTEPDVLNF